MFYLSAIVFHWWTMIGENTMEKRLYEAAFQGNVNSLLNLLEDDPLLLDRCVVGPYLETPLHIAAMLGHAELVNEILSRKPELASELNYQGSSPLHLAAAKGYLSIVKSLLAANPEMCFSRDMFGRNPVHISAIKGRIDVLKELVKAKPGVVQERMGNGDTILHLCAKNNNLDSLKVLLRIIDDLELVNSKNGSGDTILHIAAANKHCEMIHFLINNTMVDVTAPNQWGLTVIDILARSNVVGPNAPINCSLLRNENELETVEHPLPGRCREKQEKEQKGWLERMSHGLMVVATLIATVSFAVGINPPGGVWQDTSQGDEHSGPHHAGFSIFADNYFTPYYRFLTYNTVSFIASLSIILLLVSGLPLQRKLFVWILTVITWVAITGNAVTYIASVVAVTPDDKKGAIFNMMGNVMLVWASLMALLLAVHAVRLVIKSVRKILRRRNERLSSML